MTNPGSFSRVCLLVAACVSATSAAAQDAGTPVVSDERPKAPEAEASVAGIPGFLTRTLSWVDLKMSRRSGASEGFYPEFGAMIPGAGLSTGVGYRHSLSATGAVIDASAAVSSPPASWRRLPICR